jgi:hypothetical protein
MDYMRGVQEQERSRYCWGRIRKGRRGGLDGRTMGQEGSLASHSPCLSSPPVHGFGGLLVAHASSPCFPCIGSVAPEALASCCPCFMFCTRATVSPGTTTRSSRCPTAPASSASCTPSCRSGWLLQEMAQRRVEKAKGKKGSAWRIVLDSRRLSVSSDYPFLVCFTFRLTWRGCAG